MEMLLARVFLISFSLYLVRAGEEECYPARDLELPPDASAVKDGATEVYELIAGKEADGDTFKKIGLGFIAWQKIGLEVFSALPVVGDAAGVVLGILDRIVPGDVSTELKCMRALFDFVKKIDLKLDQLSKDVSYLKDLLNAQTALFSYILKDKDLLDDQSALKVYSDDPEMWKQAESACNYKAPRATRLSIAESVLSPRFSGDLVNSIATKANCNETLYVELAAIIVADMTKLTFLQEACNKIFKMSKDSSDKNYRAAAIEISNVSLALLAGRFDLERQCMEKAAETDFLTPANECKDAKYMMEKLDKKFPLIKSKKVVACEVNGSPQYEYAGGKHEGYTCDSLPSMCKIDTINIKQNINRQSDQNYKDSRQSKIYVPVPKDGLAAARRLVKLQAQKIAKTRSCYDHSQACWPCQAKTRPCPYEDE